MLTLDQLKRKGISLANRCFLCEEDEETIEHLLIHCSRAKMLWNLFLAIVDSNWVFPLMVRQSLLAWQGANVGRKHKRMLRISFLIHLGIFSFFPFLFSLLIRL